MVTSGKGGLHRGNKGVRSFGAFRFFFQFGGGQFCGWLCRGFFGQSQKNRKFGQNCGSCGQKGENLLRAEILLQTLLLCAHLCTPTQSVSYAAEDTIKIPSGREWQTGLDAFAPYPSSFQGMDGLAAAAAAVPPLGSSQAQTKGPQALVPGTPLGPGSVRRKSTSVEPNGCLAVFPFWCHGQPWSGLIIILVGSNSRHSWGVFQ